MSFNFGYSGALTAGAGFEWIGINGDNQVAYNAGTFPGGTIQSISAYMGAHSGFSAVSAKLCIWDNTGALLAASPSFSAAAGTGANNGQNWYTQSLSSPIALVAQQIYIGWWRDPAGTMEWSYATGSTMIHNGPYSSPSGILTGDTSESGQIGAYVTYVKGGIKAWSGSAWNKYAMKAFVAGAWHWYAVKAWSGSAWNRYG